MAEHIVGRMLRRLARKFTAGTTCMVNCTQAPVSCRLVIETADVATICSDHLGRPTVHGRARKLETHALSVECGSTCQPTRDPSLAMESTLAARRRRLDRRSKRG